MLITPLRGSLHGAIPSFCLARRCCSELAGSVPVVALLFHTVWESVCVWVCCYTYLMKSWTKVPGGDLKGSRRGRGVMFPSHPVSHRASSRARGEVFYPLMNWDCWSKVWIIEFLINYPELLSDKSAPLQPPSSSVVFYLIWSASCSPGLALRCPCLINSDLVMEPEAAAWLSVCFDGSYGVCPLLWWFFNDFYCLLRGNKSCFFLFLSSFVVIRSRTTWKEMNQKNWSSTRAVQFPLFVVLIMENKS